MRAATRRCINWTMVLPEIFGYGALEAPTRHSASTSCGATGLRAWNADDATRRLQLSDARSNLRRPPASTRSASEQLLGHKHSEQIVQKIYERVDFGFACQHQVARISHH